MSPGTFLWFDELKKIISPQLPKLTQKHSDSNPAVPQVILKVTCKVSWTAGKSTLCARAGYSVVHNIVIYNWASRNKYYKGNLPPKPELSPAFSHSILLVSVFCILCDSEPLAGTLYSKSSPPLPSEPLISPVN